MPTYWSHVVEQLIAQRTRWIAQYARKSAPPPDSGTTQPAAAAVTRADTTDAALALENAQLKREVAVLSTRIARLERLAQTRAAHIECLVAAMRHLRAERRRWSSLSSIEGSTSSTSSDRDTNDGDSDDSRSDELSVTFTNWSESESNESSDSDESLPTTAAEPESASL